MKTIFFTLVLSLLYVQPTLAQKVIKMERVNNTYQIPCKVNGIPMKFVFDTGASDVSISITEAKFLIKQGLLSKDDLLEKVQYQIANGDVVEGTNVNLKTIEIDGIILKNVKASIIDSQAAPLLLGQSAINKIGQYTINGSELILLDYAEKSDVEETTTNSGIIKINEEALDYFNLFLNAKSWATDNTGELTFDKYSNSLNFNSVTVIQNPMTEDESTTITTSYSIPVDDIIKIEEIVHKKVPNKDGDHNILIYTIQLESEIKHSYLMTEKGKLPEQETTYRKELTISPKKSLTDLDMKNLRLATRDVFTGVSFETSER